MHNNKTEFIENNETVLRARLVGRPQLTPTGKISHAKTRVYTQRYRKAWEQMPDFKGWLTSVPHQPTRAFCTYCKKNLHAHRLSLLKHTCTMKHQRGALMHQIEVVTPDVKTSELEDEMQDEPDEIEEVEDHDFKLEDEEAEDEDEEIEYVVERLDCDMEDEQSKDLEDDEDQYVEEEEENIPMMKKAKTEPVESSAQPDALAEAMAHVHHEYLDENGDSVNVELEMVVESPDPNAQEMRIVSVRSEREDEDEGQITIGTYDNDDNSNDYNTNDQEKENDHDNSGHDHPGTADSSYKSSMGGESSDVAYSETDDPQASSRKDYLTKPSTARSVTILPAGNNGSTNKTITLTSGGKTVITLDTSSLTSFAGGSRFVLNTKGQRQSLNEKDLQGFRNDSGTVKVGENQQQIVSVAQNANSYSTPGTSQQNSKKQIILKPVKPVAAKKPCISTHVLDTSKGLPVGGLQISLYKLMDGRWTFLNESTTTADGRCADLVDTSKYTFTAGRYKLHFDVDKYFTLRRIETMYPFIEIIFDVKNPSEHYHVPVLISPFGYTTYRGT